MGAAAMVMLAEQLHAAGIKTTVYYGAKDEDHLFCADVFRGIFVDENDPAWQENPFLDPGNVFTATDADGQLVTDLLPDDVPSGTVVYTCGPVPMMAAVQRWAKEHGLHGYASLEERLACGIGACSGCAYPMRKADGSLFYKKVCVDGPVFALEEVAFDV